MLRHVELTESNATMRVSAYQYIPIVYCFQHILWHNELESYIVHCVYWSVQWNKAGAVQQDKPAYIPELRLSYSRCSGGTTVRWETTPLLQSGHAGTHQQLPLCYCTTWGQIHTHLFAHQSGYLH